MSAPLTLLPTLIVCVGQFGARVGLRLKAILAQRPQEVHALFPMILMVDRPLEEVNRYSVPDYIPLPRWREEECVFVQSSADPLADGELAEQVMSLLERKFNTMRDSSLHMALAEQGFRVGPKHGYVPSHVFLVASFPEKVASAIILPVAHALKNRITAGDRLLGFFNLTPWKEMEPNVAPEEGLPLLRELRGLMNSDSPLFHRCYLFEAERQNRTRIVRPDDQAEAVASLLGLLLISDVYDNEGLYASATSPPAALPAELSCPRGAYAFSTFGCAAFVLPRHLLRIAAALRLGTEMLQVWWEQPEPSPDHTDRWQRRFLSDKEFVPSAVTGRFLKKLEEIPEDDYIPHIVWQRLPRLKWADAIASADSFCGRYRIPVIIEKLEHVRTAQLLPQFEESLKKDVDESVYGSAQGVRFAYKALEDLKKAIDAIVEQMEEIVAFPAADLSAHRQQLEQAVANAPQWYAPFVHLILPAALVTAATLWADWEMLTKQIVLALTWVGWFGVSAFINWLHDRKIRRLRDEYWDAVRNKWRGYLRSICDLQTCEFFKNASSVVQQEIERLDGLLHTIRAVREVFSRAQQDVLEEDFVSKTNAMSPEQSERLYLTHRPDIHQQLEQFLRSDLAQVGWRWTNRLGETAFQHAFVLWQIFDNMTIENTVAANLDRSIERLSTLRDGISVLLRVPDVWTATKGPDTTLSVEMNKAFTLALTDTDHTVLQEYVSQLPQQGTTLLMTRDVERITWMHLWYNFPLEIVHLWASQSAQAESTSNLEQADDTASCGGEPTPSSPASEGVT